MIATWSDAATLRHALAFEAALAEAQAEVGLIDADAAHRIAETARRLELPAEALAEEAALAGTLAIPLVRRLRDAVGGDGASVHLGATSQDVADTVMVLQSWRAVDLLCADGDRIAAALAPLARRYAAFPAMGRTLLQDAMPIGLGLRIAQWHAGIAEALAHLRAARAQLGIQLGGAVGSRSGLGGHGKAVASRVADTLELPVSAPWHARRTRVAGLAAALGILIGATGKMARDVALLAQHAIGEMREPAIPGRGGSSAMAHKRNPTGCQVALAAATRAPGLVAAMLTAMTAEEERGLGGWQAEASLLADLALLASGALAAMVTVVEGLDINEAVIAGNLEAARMGSDIGESVALVEQLLKENG